MPKPLEPETSAPNDVVPQDGAAVVVKEPCKVPDQLGSWEWKLMISYMERAKSGGFVSPIQLGRIYLIGKPVIFTHSFAYTKKVFHMVCR